MSEGGRKDARAWEPGEGASSPTVAPKPRRKVSSGALLFGAVWESRKAQVRRGGQAQLPARGAKRRTNLETRTLNDRRIPYHGQYRMRGRWLLGNYVGLRNAAWATRNGRVGATQNPLALRLVLVEAQRLIAQGEALQDVLEAFAELLMTP